MKHNRIVNVLKNQKEFRSKQFSEAFDLMRLFFDNVFNDQSIFSKGEVENIISMHCDGKSFKEISDFYNSDEQTVKGLYTFAKEILESCLLAIAIDDFQQNTTTINIQLSIECEQSPEAQDELIFKKVYELILNSEKVDKLAYNVKTKKKNICNLF